MSILQKIKNNFYKAIKTNHEVIKQINVLLIMPNHYQPRRIFDEEKLKELAESIKLHGVLQPIILREKKGYYEIVSGERRWRAAKLCEMTTIPAIVGEFTDGEMLEIAMLENMQRVDLENIEEAEAYTRLWDKFKNLTLEEIAYKIGKKPSEIMQKLSFLYLPTMLREAVKQDVITEEQAKKLSNLTTREQQAKALEKIQQRKNSLMQYTEKVIKLLKEEDELNQTKDSNNYLNFSARNILYELLSSMEEVGIKVQYKEEKKAEKRVITIELADYEVETKILKVT